MFDRNLPASRGKDSYYREGGRKSESLFAVDMGVR
jgi:hypothetical protein